MMSIYDNTELERLIEAAGGIQAAAEKAGMKPGHLKAVVAGDAEPALGDMHRLIEALGIERTQESIERVFFTKARVSLETARTAAGLTTKQAATAAGVSEQTLKAWETGRTQPKISQARKLSAAYGVPLDGIDF